MKLFSRRIWRAVILISFSASLLTAGLGLPKSAMAADVSNFQAGRLMDDNIFFNSGSMNYDDIKSFLASQVPSCDTNGTQSITYWYNPSDGFTSSYSSETGASQVTTSRATFGQRYDYYRTQVQGLPSDGSTAPYTCLKDFHQDIPAMPADSYCAGSISAGTNNDSAQIIYEVSRACGINPQVLIVLLQKEQALVTDDWPWTIEYTDATGYSCTDTSPCDPTFAGFFNQLYWAAHQFQHYVKVPSLFNFRVGQSSNVQYNPNTSCGSSSIYMQTAATAALYNYTPYQPNVAALNNLYGTGDSCSSYGNRNFWRDFSDWFGSPINPCGSDPVEQPVTSHGHVPGDYTGDGRADAAIFRPSDGCWHVRGYGDVQFGQPGDIPVPADYNGDGKTDIAVFRPSQLVNGQVAWHIRGVGDYAYGLPGDIPVPGDYNGDGKADIAVYRPSEIVNGQTMWHINGVGDFAFGQPGDIPVPADYNGDGKTDIAVFRPSTGDWHIRGVGDYNAYGQNGDIPVPGNYPGFPTGAVFRPLDGGWRIRAYTDFPYGYSTDIPVPSDYNGDGKTDAAVFRPSTGDWHIRGVGDWWGYGSSTDIPAIQTLNAMLLKQYGLINSY